MEKKRIYLSSPTMHGEEQKYVQEAFDTNWVAPLGPNVNELEKEVASYAGCKAAAALSAGISDDTPLDGGIWISLISGFITPPGIRYAGIVSAVERPAIESGYSACAYLQNDSATAMLKIRILPNSFIFQRIS